MSQAWALEDYAATDSKVLRALGHLEDMLAAERDARLQLESQIEQVVTSKLDDHEDGLQILMDMLEGVPTAQSVEDVVNSAVGELRQQCDEALRVQTQENEGLQNDIAADLEGLANRITELEQRLETTVEAKLQAKHAQAEQQAADLGGRLEDLEAHMNLHVATLENKISEASAEAVQRMQIADAKHESLEQTLGIRFDARLVRVEEVVSSVESRINSELFGFEEKLEAEFARLETLEGAMSKKVSDSSAQLLRVLDKSMTTLDSQMHSQAEVINNRFDQVQRHFDISGTLTEFRDRIAQGEKNMETLVEPLAARTLALETRSQGVESVLQDKGGRWDKSQTKIQQIELELERYQKRTEEGMATLRSRQDQGGKETRDLRALIDTSKMELRKDIERCPKADEVKRVREDIDEVKENARDTQKRLQDDIRDRAAKCGVDLQAAQRDLSSTIVRCETTLDSKISTQLDTISRLQKKQDEATVATKSAIKAELQAFETTSAARIEKAVGDAEENIEASVSGIRGRVERLELLHHDTAEGNRRVEDRCSALEASINQRVREAEAKASTADTMVVESFRRFSEQTTTQLDAIERKVDFATDSLKTQLEDSTERLRNDLGVQVERLDAADSATRSEQLSTKDDLQKQIALEAGSIKEISKAELKRQDDKITRSIDSLTSSVTEQNLKLREDVDKRVSDQDNKISSDLAFVKQDAREKNEQMQQSLSDSIASIKEEIATKGAAMDARVTEGLAECEQAIEGKAEVKLVRTLEMLLRQDLEETNEGLKQLNDELGEHHAHMESLEGRLEKDEGETSELATDFQFLEATMSAIEMGQADLQEAVSNQIVAEVGACKANSEDKAEELRRELQEKLAGFKTELDETVVKQMSSRISQSEKALKDRVTIVEERVNDAASKVELKTQLSLLKISLDEVSQGVQALDDMVNEDAEVNALTDRLEKLDGMSFVASRASTCAVLCFYAGHCAVILHHALTACVTLSCRNGG